MDKLASEDTHLYVMWLNEIFQREANCGRSNKEYIGNQQCIHPNRHKNKANFDFNVNFFLF